jgi:phosphonoacetate hydrolase
MISLNGRMYRRPKRPVVVVCVDGCAPRYIEQGLQDRILPNIERFAKNGFVGEALGIIPSFTNPNNLSIVTGAPASVHGIVGNYFLNPRTGEEVMMDDPKFLRCETLFAEFSKAGTHIVIITAKEKLRKLLGHHLRNGICFSSEKADQCRLDENGIENVLDLVGRPLPDVYSAELSFLVLEAGLKILRRKAPDLMYLSLTDYIQHKYPPGTKEANAFLQGLDESLGHFAGTGALVAVTADHGMNDKSKADGSPNVIYLQDVLDQEFKSGTTKVICPITDSYVVHHGSLGSFVMVYCHQELRPAHVAGLINGLAGVEKVLSREMACKELELPPDLVGDLIVLGDEHTVLGSTSTAHDLSALKGARLRSHGGLAEQRVPFILSSPLAEEYATLAASRPLRNFDIFDFALNGIL